MFLVSGQAIFPKYHFLASIPVGNHVLNPLIDPCYSMKLWRLNFSTGKFNFIGTFFHTLLTKYLWKKVDLTNGSILNFQIGQQRLILKTESIL
jgi:hypothetical protein